jgi:hypothetical protein
MLAILLASLISTHCGDLCGPVAIFHYADLLQRGGHGRFGIERGAFLIRESDGTLTTEPWPEFGHRQVRYRGPIPANAIAIMHTHPHEAPRPSAHDRAEAKKIGLPVLVITPMGVVAAFPDGRSEKIVKGWDSPR